MLWGIEYLLYTQLDSWIIFLRVPILFIKIVVVTLHIIKICCDKTEENQEKNVRLDDDDDKKENNIEDVDIDDEHIDNDSNEIEQDGVKKKFEWLSSSLLLEFF